MNEFLDHLNIIVGFSWLIADQRGVAEADTITDAMRAAARKVERIGWNITDELKKTNPAGDKVQEYLVAVTTSAEQLVASAAVPVVHRDVSYLSQRILVRVEQLRACFE